jgi:hypothetical protein
MSAAGGERVSRRELLETIDKQSEQLSRYETRLRDVVRAYKGLAKEKEALEKSLTAISGKEKDDIVAQVGDSESTKSGNSKPGNSDQSDTESIASSANEEVQPDTKVLKARVRTLAASLSTLSSEKSRLEVQFQESKKKSMLERSDNEKKIELLKQELASVKASAKKELEETK